MEKVTDNFNTGFPARMSDGRFLTNYWPNCALNSGIQGEMNSYIYRQFLTNNATSLMQNMNMINKAEYGCEECFPDIKVNPGSRYVQECSPEGCRIKEINPQGIGIKQKLDNLRKKAQNFQLAGEEVEEDEQPELVKEEGQEKEDLDILLNE